MKKPNTLPALFITAMVLSACSSSDDVAYQKKDPKQYEIEWQKEAALAKQREEQKFQLYSSDCVLGLTELSWIGEIYRGGWREEVYQKCMNQFRADLDEEGFHKKVIRQLQGSHLWFDSAVWLKQKGQFADLLDELCVNKTEPGSKTLYLPHPKYPVAAARDRLGGVVHVTAKFDGSGFFKEIVELKGTPEHVFDRSVKRQIEKAVVCPIGEESVQTLVIEFRLDGTQS